MKLFEVQIQQRNNLLEKGESKNVLWRKEHLN